MRYIVTGRKRIRKYWFSEKYETFEDFLDVLLFESRAAAETRLAALQAYAERLNTPPFPMGEEKHRLTAAANIDAAISELTGLCVNACEIVLREGSLCEN